MSVSWWQVSDQPYSFLFILFHFFLINLFDFADVAKYLSLVAAFLWLNCFGYYIWKTFRSRNVFLRVTDGRKYCYYSTYAWGCTLGMTAVALVAHFLFDEDKGMPVTPHGQKTIGR